MLRTKFKYENKQRAITKKANNSYGICALPSPLMRSIHPQNFITIVSIVLEICSGQNSSMKINKRAITQKLSKREFWFLCTALCLDEIYPPMKIHNRSKHSLGDMLQEKWGTPPARPPRVIT